MGPGDGGARRTGLRERRMGNGNVYGGGDTGVAPTGEPYRDAARRRGASSHFTIRVNGSTYACNITSTPTSDASAMLWKKT